jgi:hypothetical protein
MSVPVTYIKGEMKGRTLYVTQTKANELIENKIAKIAKKEGHTNGGLIKADNRKQIGGVIDNTDNRGDVRILREHDGQCRQLRDQDQDDRNGDSGIEAKAGAD